MKIIRNLLLPVARATLDNGLRVVIVATNLAPMVTIHVNHLGGPVPEAAEKRRGRQ